MLLKGENRNTRRRTCRRANYSTTDLKGTEFGSNLGLSGETPANSGLNPGTSVGLYALLDFTRKEY
jgi:hypothetical protein